jgi:hypothetical protein
MAYEWKALAAMLAVRANAARRKEARVVEEAAPQAKRVSREAAAAVAPEAARGGDR